MAREYVRPKISGRTAGRDVDPLDSRTVTPSGTALLGVSKETYPHVCSNTCMGACPPLTKERARTTTAFKTEGEEMRRTLILTSVS